MDVYDAIAKRRSVRSFDGRPVSHEVLERIVAAAGAAPSAHNEQPWHFHVTTGATRAAVSDIVALSTVHLQEYLEMLPTEQFEAAERFFAGLGNAPVVVVVSVPAVDDELARINDYMATGGAIENLLLAAVNEGLACCNVTFAFWVRDKLAELLRIGSDREIVSLVLIGYAAEEPIVTQRRGDIATYLG